MIAKLVFRKAFYLILTTAILLSIKPVTNTQAQGSLPDIDDYYFHSSWGGEGKQILRPEDVAVTTEGKIYILNTEFNRITIVDNEGYIYKEIGGFGEEDGEFNLPLSLAINDAGEIFVSDTWNRRMQKFDSEGNHLLTFGTFGEGVGEIFAPMGIALDNDGNLLVADGNNKIIKFSPNGDFLSEWGTDIANPGSGEGEFDHPSDVAVDGDGNIYVADSGNSRIQIFDSSANYVDSIDIMGDGYPDNPHGIAVDLTGRLFVSGNDKIYIYDITDTDYPLTTWGQSGTSLGDLYGPAGIFVDQNSGEVYVAETMNNRVSVFNSTGEIITAFGTPDMIDGYFYYPLDTIIVNNQVYVTDSQNNRIQVFNKDGTFLFDWGTSGSEDGQFFCPSGIDSDSSGNVYVVDKNNRRVQKFDQTGAFLDKIIVPLSEEDGTLDCTPKGIAIDPADNIFITISDYSGTGRILKFDSTMNYQGQWEGGGDSIAVDSVGNVYTTAYNRVQSYDNDGNFLYEWGEGPGPYKGLRGIAIDNYDDVYVMDLWNPRIIKYTNDGTYLGEFGTQGNGPGEFAYGGEMAITDDGIIYVVDGENQRVQVIAPTLPDPDPESGLVINGNFGSSEIVEISGKVGMMKLDIFSNLDRSDRDSVSGLENWVYGGSLPVDRSDVVVNESLYSLQLGENNIPSETQGISEAWAYQVFYVRPEWLKPVLKLNYNVFTNDAKSKSNFIAEIQDGVGLNNLEVIVLEGFVGAAPGEVPVPATELGWKSAEFDLSPYRGQHIRLAFGNRNLYPDSLGIWSYVEKVEVKDEANKFYFPLIQK